MEKILATKDSPRCYFSTMGKCKLILLLFDWMRPCQETKLKPSYVYLQNHKYC